MSTLSNVYGYNGADLTFECIFNDLLEAKRRLAGFIIKTEPIILEACERRKSVLMEGAQGFLLDPDFGTYPQTTSSSCTLAGALQGSGVSWRYLKEVIGVVKAYTTRVCEKIHPFATEMSDDMADILRRQAGEYGSTTGRARRIGWLDASQLREAAATNGLTGLAVTRMDNLGILPVARIWNGSEYLEMPGWWGSDVNGRRARKYLRTIQSLAGVPIKYVSYGPERNQIIVKK